MSKARFILIENEDKYEHFHMVRLNNSESIGNILNSQKIFIH